MKKVYMLLFLTIATLTYGADEPPNKRRRVGEKNPSQVFAAQDQKDDNVPGNYDIYMQELHAADNGKPIIELLKAANSLDMKNTLDACTKHAVSYYSNPNTIKQFLEKPKSFEYSINLAPELQEPIVLQLLQKHKDKLLGFLLLDKELEYPMSFDSSSVLCERLTYSPDGSQIAARFSNGTVCIWNPMTEQIVLQFDHKENGPTYEIAYNHDGSRLATVGKGAVVNIWCTKTGALLQKFEHPNREACQILTIAYSHDGSFLTAGSDNGGLYAWNTENGKLNHHPPIKKEDAFCSIASGSHKNQLTMFLLATEKGLISVSSFLQGKLISTIKQESMTGPSIVVHNHNNDDSQWAIADKEAGTVKTRHSEVLFKFDKQICGLTYNPNHSSELAIVDKDGKIFIGNTATKKLYQHDTITSSPSLAYNCDGSLATVTLDKKVRISRIFGYREVVQPLNIIQALYVSSRLHKDKSVGLLDLMKDGANKQYFEKLYDSLPTNTIKQILEHY